MNRVANHQPRRPHLGASGTGIALLFTLFNGGAVHRRLEEIKIDLSRRIRPILPELPPHDFDELIERMAALQAKYETRRDVDYFRATEP